MRHPTQLSLNPPKNPETDGKMKPSRLLRDVVRIFSVHAIGVSRSIRPGRPPGFTLLV